MPYSRINRRQLLQASTTGMILAPYSSQAEQALPQSLHTILQQHYPDRPLQQRAVSITLPALSENGNSVSLTIAVNQAEIPAGIKSIAVFSEKNPVKLMASFQFPPPPPQQLIQVATRVRLADSQTLAAVAETYDKQLVYATASIIVTLAACVNLS